MIRIDRSTSPSNYDLWHHYGADMVRLATMLVGPHDAHDVAFDAYTRASARLGDDVRDERAYLMRAVVNRAHDLRRSNERRWRRDLVAVGPSTTDSPDTHADVRREVASLSLAQRTVVFFAYWEDLTEREIADVLQVSHGTVRRHLVRARQHLRKALQ